MLIGSKALPIIMEGAQIASVLCIGDMGVSLVKELLHSIDTALFLGSSHYITGAGHQLGGGAIVKKIFLKHGLQLARHVHAIQNGDGLAIAAHGLGYTHQVVIGLLEAKAVMEHHLPLQS